MLPQVSVSRHCCAESTNLDNYRPLMGDELIDQIVELSKSLEGLRVCHVNATASGGGVAELLARELPIYRALGLRADWRIIHGDKHFFEVTKAFHNALQGADFSLTSSMTRSRLHFFISQRKDTASGSGDAT